METYYYHRLPLRGRIYGEFGMCTRVYQRTQLRSTCSGASGKRGDFQHILYEAAKERGTIVRFNCQVADVDDDGPSVTLRDGEKIEADLIVAADGTL